MKYGIFEMKKFADSSDDPRVKLMFERLQETRSKLARSTEEIARLTKQRDELMAVAWHGEISRRSRKVD